MRLGTLVSVPNQFSRFGRVMDGYGVGYTVERGDLPDDAQVGDEVGYKVELWGNDSGLAYDLYDLD